MGDVIIVKFWEHVWCRDCTFKEAFLEFHCICKVRDSSIAKVMCFSSGRIHWDV